jgi:ribosomal protein S18 acetylase RimI-like enzyme
LEIRRFKPEDARPVAELIVKTLQTVNVADYSGEYIAGLIREYTPEYILERAGWTHFYVVSDGGSIVGSGAIGSYYGKKDESCIFTVFVSPEYEGRGIGKMIMQTLENDIFFRRAKRVEVPASITACGFYRKLGYQHKAGGEKLDENLLYKLEKFR